MSDMNIAVVRGGLGYDAGTTNLDLTVAGFGTVKAAILISCYSTTTSNPSTSAESLSIGVWDGTNMRCVGGSIQNGVATSNTDRIGHESRILYFTNFSASAFIATYSISNITDGIRVSLVNDATGGSRYVTAILFTGSDVESAVGSITPATSSGNSVNVTSLSFEPNLIFVITAADIVRVTTHKLFGLGIAANKSSIINRGILLSDSDALSTTRNAVYLGSNICTGQAYLDNLDWSGNISNFLSNGFTLYTASGSTGGDVCFYLALKVPVDLFDIIDLETPTTIGTQKINLGFLPTCLMSIFANPTALDTISQGISYSIGISNGFINDSYAGYSVDNRSTASLAASHYTSNFINLYNETNGSALVIGDIIGAVVDGYIVNYTQVDSSNARKGFLLAFGNNVVQKTIQVGNQYLLVHK